MRRLTAGLTIVLVSSSVGVSTTAQAAGQPVVEVDDGRGSIDTTITIPGDPGSGSSGSGGGARPVGGGGGGPTGPVVTCEIVVDGNSAFGRPYTIRVCSDGTQYIVPPFDGPPTETVTVTVMTPADLAQQARDSLVLPRPAAHRSPQENNSFEGSPFTWVNLWTWVWTDRADYQPLRNTVSLAGVSATVTATPKALLFEPGDGGATVSCAGPGRPWSEADGNDAPPDGCGYRYRHVTDGPVTSRVGISWSITWTGSGGQGGTLPDMQTYTSGPVRVLQSQSVNR